MGASVTEARVVRFELPYLPPKEYATNSNSHWSAQRDKKTGARQQVQGDVDMLLLESGWRPGQMLQNPRFTVTFFLPTKAKRDHDGLVQRMKPIYDSLTESGVILDDNLDVIDWPQYRHNYRKGQPGTLVEIREAATEVTVARRQV